MTLTQQRLPFPPWVWVELELGELNRSTHHSGIRAIIEQWQGGILMHYRAHPAEEQALRNLSDEARMWKRAGQSVFMTELHWQIVRLDRAVRHHLPHITGQAYLEWIAAHMGWRRRHGGLDVFRVSDYLDHADAILALRERLGLNIEVRDITESALKRMKAVA